MRLEHIFGMPPHALVVLAALPVGFFVYDIACLYTKGADQPRFLRGISLLNLSYCAISVGYLVHHARQLTALGWIYFAVELAVVLAIAAEQWRTAAAFCLRQIR